MELTNEERIMLFEVAWGNINAQFEMWVAITFAVIIASYVAGHKLQKPLQYLIAALYLLVTVLVVTVTLGTASFAEQFGDSETTNVVYQTTISIVRGGVFLLGTVATLVFVFKGHRDVESDS